MNHVKVAWIWVTGSAIGRNTTCWVLTWTSVLGNNSGALLARCNCTIARPMGAYWLSLLVVIVHALAVRLVSIAIVNAWPLTMAQVSWILATLSTSAWQRCLTSAWSRPRGSLARGRLNWWLGLARGNSLHIPHGADSILQVLQILLLLHKVLRHLLLISCQLLETILATISLRFDHLLLWCLLNSTVYLKGHILVIWSLFLDIVYVYVVYSIVEVSNVQGKRVVVYQFHVVYLFVDVLVPWGDLAASFGTYWWGTRRVAAWHIIWSI